MFFAPLLLGVRAYDCARQRRHFWLGLEDIVCVGAIISPHLARAIGNSLEHSAAVIDRVLLLDWHGQLFLDMILTHV